MIVKQPPTLDYTIMLNAYEESRLAELLADYRRSPPTRDIDEARNSLTPRLIELIQAGKVGIYELPLDRRVPPSDYRELTSSEAVALVSNPASWSWEDPGATKFYCLFRLDEHFWGEPAG